MQNKSANIIQNQRVKSFSQNKNKLPENMFDKIIKNQDIDKKSDKKIINQDN